MEIYIIAGFSGAGKTNFINQCASMFSGKTVVLQNESGEVKLNVKSGIEVSKEELMSGCICCTLALTFKQSIIEIIEKNHPDRIIIEASGSAYLKETAKACIRTEEERQNLFSKINLITIVDLSCLEECLEGLGLVFKEQIQSAKLLLLSHMNEVKEEDRERLIKTLRTLNEKAVICEKDFKELDQQELGMLLENVESCDDIELLSYMNNYKKIVPESPISKENKMMYLHLKKNKS